MSLLAGMCPYHQTTEHSPGTIVVLASQTLGPGLPGLEQAMGKGTGAISVVGRQSEPEACFISWHLLLSEIVPFISMFLSFLSVSFHQNVSSVRAEACLSCFFLSPGC